MRKRKIPNRTVEYLPQSSLKKNPRNARTDSPQQIKLIAESVKYFGFNNPILIDDHNMIVAGHGRWDAAAELGMDLVPTIRLSGLTKDQIRAYILADNQLALKAGWEKSILAIELQHLLRADLDFDVTITGFEVPEIDLILQEASQQSDPADELEPASNGPAVTRPGDLWKLGEHVILCGNSLDPGIFAQLLPKLLADVVFVDPPYNVPIDGNVSGNGSIKHSEFAMAAGEMSEAEFIEFLSTAFSRLVEHSKPGSIHFACMDWRHIGEILAAGKKVYDSLLNLCIWAKDNGGMGSFYRSQHELVFVFRNGKAKHRNNIQLGRFGRNRSNLWSYPGANTLSRQNIEGNLLAMHPTVKPVALVADALLDCSAPRNVVLDCFLGSGSTLLAAERTGRICRGIELDPLYVDVALRRWRAQTGRPIVHVNTGMSFEEREKEVLYG